MQKLNKHSSEQVRSTHKRTRYV